jgi:hypothetical protein
LCVGSGLGWDGVEWEMVLLVLVLVVLGWWMILRLLDLCMVLVLPVGSVFGQARERSLLMVVPLILLLVLLEWLVVLALPIPRPLEGSSRQTCLGING